MGPRRGDDVPAPAGREGTPALVLIADDNADAREIYATYFEFCGYRVATASDGREALRQAVELFPDVVLLDLSMPGLDGWQTARTLRSDPATRDILIVALSGHALKGAERVALDAGCDRYLIKPCLPEDAVAAVNAMLNDSALRRRPA
jgi:CheY-like chemotaxis protein